MHGTLHLYIWDVTRNWNHDFARCGEVTNARNKKRTVLCALSYLRLFAWRLHRCEMRSMRASAWFNCLLRSSKSILQLCGLSEHVDIAFIIKMVWLLSDLYVFGNSWKGSGCRRCTRLEVTSSKSLLFICDCDLHCSLFLHNMLL